MLPRTVWSFIWQKVTETTIKWLESTQCSMLVKLAAAEEIAPFSTSPVMSLQNCVSVRKMPLTAL